MRLWPLVLVLCACGSDKAADSGDVTTPTFTQVRDDILFKSCALSTCHLPGEEGATDGELEFDPTKPELVYDSIVNATAALNKVLITPGDIDNSFLITKVIGEQGADEGDPMPPPFGLNAQDAQRLVLWVEAGAPND